MTSRPATEPPRLSRFRVVRELGGGAQGAVHEAIDLERGVGIAVKTLQKLGPEEIARFKVEFRAVRDLRHPNLVTLGELIEEDGRWFFTMELVLGVDFITHVRAERGHDDSTSWPAQRSDDLRTRVDVRTSGGHLEADTDPPPAGPVTPHRTHGGFDEERLRRALGQLAAALSFLHAAGKVHRDLKPSNVLVDAAGRVVVIDFGVVAELTDRDEEAQLVGTVAYMAPEQALAEPVGPAADWYAVGVLLFEALSGRRPFHGSAEDIIEAKCALDAPSVSDFVSDAPPDLDALCMRLLARDPARRPDGAEVLRALGRDAPSEPGARAEGSMLPPAFVGRKRELDALGEAYRTVRARGAAAVLIEGESGVGKSALVKRFVQDLRATERKIVVLEGRCHEQERVPYNAFDAVIDAVARYVRARGRKVREQLLPPGMDRLQQLFPTVGLIDEVGGAPPRPPSQPPLDLRADRDEAFAVLRELFARVARHRPTVLVLDDVQWADADSLALLEQLTAPPGAPPLLLLATARRRADGTSCAAFGAIRCPVRGLSLGGLAERDASELVDQLLSAAPPAIDRASIIESTRGHPMFIEELMRYLARPHATTAAVGLDDALFARIAELDPDARRILSLVVVAGMPIARDAVASAASIEAAAYARHVAALREARLVRAHGARHDDAIEPYHDRVREAVLARLEPAELRALHGTLGAVLEGRGAGPELLFHHFAHAGDADRAARYAELAAEMATRALAFDRAAALYRSAVEVGLDDPLRRRRLLGALGDRLACAGRSKEAADSFLAAAQTGVVPPAERLELERRAAEQFLMGGHVAEGLAATRGVLHAFGLSLPTNRLSALARLTWYRLRLGTHALTWAPRPPADAASEAIARIDTCWSVGAGLGMVDSVRSMLFVNLGALLALEHGDEIRIARALAAASVAEAGLGRRVQAARLAGACRRAVASDGSDRARFYESLATRAARFFLDNDWTGSWDGAREALRLWQSSGRTEGWEADIVEQFACWSLDNGGRLIELRERVPARIRAAQRAGNRFVEVNFRTQFAALYLLRDEADEARADVEDAIASWRPGSTDFGNQDYLALRSLTYVALYAGDLAAAERLLPRWGSYFTSLMSRVVFLRQDALAFVGSIALARAAVARTRGDSLETQRRLREAQRAAAEVGAIALPMAHAYALRLRAGIHAVQGESDAAQRVMLEALRDAEVRDTRLEAACLRWRLADLVGGDEGKRLRVAAERWMVTQGARVPERLVAAILPGWPHPG